MSEGSYFTKPGVLGRAFGAFMLFNLVLGVSLAVAVWLIGAVGIVWLYLVLAIVFSVAQFIIVMSTIADPIGEWVSGKEYVKEGKKPSWE